MPITLLLLTIALAAPPPDPVALTVNLREVRLSELRSAMADRPPSEITHALRELTQRALLLQEADRSGLGDGLPEEPRARAAAYLKRVVPEAALCRNVNERQLADMYAVMKPRFVHGDLYDVAEIRWSCPKNLSPDGAHCRYSSEAYAREHWRPVAPFVRTKEDLVHVGERAGNAGPVRYVELTFHVGPDGRATVPKNVADAVTALRVGHAVVTHDESGARIHLLTDHRPPQNRPLSDPEVERQVRDELCPRLVQQGETTYLDGLTRSALLKIHREVLPKEWRDALEKPK